jgi:hypothetical protein
MIRRQLNNLANSYAKQGDSERAQDLSTLRDLLGDDSQLDALRP